MGGEPLLLLVPARACGKLQPALQPSVRCVAEAQSPGAAGGRAAVEALWGASGKLPQERCQAHRSAGARARQIRRARKPQRRNRGGGPWSGRRLSCQEFQ